MTPLSLLFQFETKERATQKKLATRAGLVIMVLPIHLEVADSRRADRMVLR
jgi:hypothetical protein